MALTAKDNTFTPMPGGFHKARLVMVADCGTQNSDKYDPAHKLWLEYEAMVDGEPRTAGKTFTLSLYKDAENPEKSAALLPAVEALVGKELAPSERKRGVDLAGLVGEACGIVVETREADGKTTVTIRDFARLDGDPPPEASRTAVFDMDTDTELPKDLPRFVCDMIRKAPEWKGAPATPAPKSLADDDDPEPTTALAGVAELHAKTAAATVATGAEFKDDEDIPF